MAIAPKLSPVLNIAIAGHASERLAKSQHASLQIKEAIAKRISELATKSQDFIKREPVNNIYNADESLTIRILTGQVDGTDQLAIQLAQENHYKLACIVPDDRVEALDYPLETLSFNAQKNHLPEEIYQQRDDLLLVHANLLMVVWDGDVNPHHKSGTTWLVQQALLRSIPIYWLDISQPTLSWHTNSSQGKLSINQEIICQQLFYNWNDNKLTSFKSTFFTADNNDTLSAVIEQLFLPTEFNNDKKPKNELEQKKDIDINEFFTHNFLLATTGGFEKTMHALVRFKLGDVWKGIKSCFSFRQNKHENMFTFADLAANDVSGRYRNSIWLSFLLSASAVIVAVIGALPTEQVHDVHEAAHHAAVHWTTYVELVLIGWILWLVSRATFRGWHRWWLPLRAISEMLKYHTDLKDVYGNELGIGALSTQALRMPSSTWEDWVFKQIYKAQPLADQSCLTTKGLRVKIKAIIENQLEYHESKHEKEHKLHHHLHRFSIILFIATLVAVAAHFFVHWPWLLIATAGFPAVAAAIHGILTMSESERIAEQSCEMKKMLENYQKALSDLPNDESWTTMLATRNLAAQVVTTMVNENQTWKSLIRARSPELPA